MTKVLIVRADGSTEATEVARTLEAFQAIVGGYIEGIGGTASFGEWRAYCNEEGKLNGLPVNVRATALAMSHGWQGGGDFLVGDVVFFGPADRDGDETDVAPELWALGV